MKALLSHEPGGPETLRLTEVPDPQAGPGELLVRVKAAAINFPDVLIIEDKYQLKPTRPFAPGGEIAGEIEAVGERVQGWNVGDRIARMAEKLDAAIILQHEPADIAKLPAFPKAAE